MDAMDAMDAEALFQLAKQTALIQDQIGDDARLQSSFAKKAIGQQMKTANNAVDALEQYQTLRQQNDAFLRSQIGVQF